MSETSIVLRRLSLAAGIALLLLPALACAAPAKDGSRAMGSALAHALRRVTVADLDAAGVSGVSDPAQFPRQALTGRRLRRDGKPEVLSATLAWCPQCAANSWGLALALARFGTLSGLRVLDSGTYNAAVLGASPAYSHTKGLSFYRATYRSRWITLRTRTVQDRLGEPLQPLGRTDRAALSFAGGSYPAIDIGGTVGATGSSYSPEFLQGRSAPDIGRALSRPHSAIGRGADGLANFFSAAICRATGGRPAAVCASPGVEAAAGKLY